MVHNFAGKASLHLHFFSREPHQNFRRFKCLHVAVGCRVGLRDLRVERQRCVDALAAVLKEKEEKRKKEKVRSQSVGERCSLRTSN